LVDAADSKSAVRKDVLVRFRSRAQNFTDWWSFFYQILAYQIPNNRPI